MKNQSLFSALLFVFLLVVAVISIQLISPPSVVDKTTSLLEFSTERAFDHLKIIAAQPHSSGTKEHKHVREFIYDYCVTAGLETQIQDTTVAVIAAKGNGVVAGRVKNIIATLKGKLSKKQSIIVMSHYDSDPNTPGAADDGAGVSAMLETIRALQKNSPLDHDVIFLFTDLEERGLLGAEAFVKLHPRLYDNHILLNYESRGNQGSAFAFEVTDENGWMVNQFAHGAPYPLLNSLAYEVYKLLPNGTDFTQFREKDFTGINQANVGGHSHYHHETDTPENIDLRIVQHHGSNMLAMIRYLDKQDLTKTRSPDVTYYNPIGYWVWVYSSGLNLPYMIVCVVLFGAHIFLVIKKVDVRFAQIFVLSGIFLLAMATAMGAGWLIVRVIIKIYPHYANFGHFDFYNSAWYSFVLLGATYLTTVAFIKLSTKKINPVAFVNGVFLVALVIMIVLYTFLPTASFLMYYPLISILLINNIALMFNLSSSHRLLIYTISMIPAVALMVPFASVLYSTFVLSLPYGSIFLWAILLGWATPLIASINISKRWLLLPGVLVMITGFVVGHIQSEPSHERPLPVELNYYLDADKKTSRWFSSSNFVPAWLMNYVKDQQYEIELSPAGLNRKFWSGEAALYNLAASKVSRTIDTLETGGFRNTLNIIPQRNVIDYRVWMKGSEASQMKLDGTETAWQITSDSTDHFIFMRAINSGGFEFSFYSDAVKPIELMVIERSLNIPEEWLFVPKPNELGWEMGLLANAVFVKQKIKL